MTWGEWFNVNIGEHVVEVQVRDNGGRGNLHLRMRPFFKLEDDQSSFFDKGDLDLVTTDPERYTKLRESTLLVSVAEGEEETTSPAKKRKGADQQPEEEKKSKKSKTTEVNISPDAAETSV